MQARIPGIPPLDYHSGALQQHDLSDDIRSTIALSPLFIKQAYCLAVRKSQ